jgi:hypothetical protein
MAGGRQRPGVRASAIGALVAVAALVLAAAPARGAVGLPAPWDGTNPFACELRQAGLGPTGPDPGADPYCVEFDKRRQNVTGLGIVDFLLKEPARVAAALGKCFYFQADHWRAAVVQEDGRTVLWEWDGRYFFDKARGNGGVLIEDLRVAGIPLPAIGWRTTNDLPVDPACARRAAADPGSVYAP